MGSASLSSQPLLPHVVNRPSNVGRARFVCILFPKRKWHYFAIRTRVILTYSMVVSEVFVFAIKTNKISLKSKMPVDVYGWGASCGLVEASAIVNALCNSFPFSSSGTLSVDDFHSDFAFCKYGGIMNDET